MKKYRLELTSEEAALVEVTDLRLSRRNHDEAHAAYLANRRPILALLKSLSKRGAIPAERLNYWNDPDYNSDRRYKVSNKGLFERNGCTGQEIYTPRTSFPTFAISCSVRISPIRLSRSSRRRSATPIGSRPAISFLSASAHGISPANITSADRTHLKNSSSCVSTWGSGYSPRPA